MTPERWQQVKEIFYSAIERGADEREAFLDEACGPDAALRREVESLIRSHEQTGSFIDSPAYEAAAELIAGGRTAGLTIGQRINSYEVLSTLGRGGMGEVYLAQDRKLGRKVALKLFPASFLKDINRVRRFEQEARAASALNHPNILTIYEVGEVDSIRFIATEYVEGETLRQRMARKPLAVDDSLSIAIQVADALAAAHEAGIIHRDIKPENIMLRRRDGYVKVLDFGLAKLTEAKTAAPDGEAPTRMKVNTASGLVMGTARYMSPEQARGQTVDARTDIFSLGVVIYEMIAGRAPFEGETPSDLIASILKTEPAQLSQLAPETPAELTRIVTKALRKDREKRYQAIKELLLDLKSLKEELDFAARLGNSSAPTARESSEMTTSLPQSITAVDSVGRTGEVGGVTNTLSAALSMEIKRHKTGIVLAVAALAVLLGSAAFGLYKYFNRAQRVEHFQRMRITQLTNTGKVIDAAISPDGKYLAYVLSDAGMHSLWIRQVTATNDTQIIPPAHVGFFGLTFSRDGNSIYYALKVNNDWGTLYRIPVLGGTPQKLLERIDGPVTFSPDGKRLALVRSQFPAQGESSIVIANADGTNEQTIATLKSPDYFYPIAFTGPSWSPDGQFIASSAATLGKGARIISIRVQDGAQTVLTPQKWWSIGRVEWLQDMSGLVVVGLNRDSTAPQVWFLSYPDGQERQVTNDLNSYRLLSFTSDTNQFVTIQTSGNQSVWIAPGADALRAFQLPTGNVGWLAGGGEDAVSAAPDGHIVYVSTGGSKISEIWIMDSNGGNRRQLTNGGNNRGSVVSPDGRYIVFTSGRNGAPNIWRMSIDGSNPVQLTKGLVDRMPSFTPDGQWVIYMSIIDNTPTLWKVSINGGDAVKISDHQAKSPVVSPDGRYIAYLYSESNTGQPQPDAPANKLAVIPFEGGEPVKVFDVPIGGIVAPILRWSQDGRSLLYNVTRNSLTNIWSQPFDGGQPKQLTDFRDSFITAFDFTRDGQLICVRGNLTRDAVLITDLK